MGELKLNKALERLWDACAIADDLREAGEEDAARAIFEEVAIAGGAANYASWVLGTMLTEDGDLDGAERHLIAATRSTTPAVAAVWADLGDLLASRGDVIRAEAAFQKAVDIGEPQIVFNALLGLGALYANSDDYTGMSRIAESLPEILDLMLASGDEQQVAFASEVRGHVNGLVSTMISAQLNAAVPATAAQNADDLDAVLSGFDFLANGDVDDIFS